MKCNIIELFKRFSHILDVAFLGGTMNEILLYIFIFLLVYLFYVVFVLKRENVFKKFKNGKEISYLKYKYNIKINKENEKKISKSIFLANSFILSTTVSIVFMLENIFLQILVGIFCLIVLILVSYHALGKIYRRR